MAAIMNIDGRVVTNDGLIESLNGRASANTDGIGVNGGGIAALDGRLMGLDATAMTNMMTVADLQGKSQTNMDGTVMNSDEIKRLQDQSAGNMMAIGNL